MRKKRCSQENVFGLTLADIIRDSGDQIGRIKFLASKHAGIRKTGGMANNKNELVFWTDLNHHTKWSPYHVRIALHCIASGKIMRKMV